MEQRINGNQLQDILLEFEHSAKEANARGEIFDFFKQHNIPYDEYDECSYDKSRVRLLIAGQTSIPVHKVQTILKSLNIDKNRVDLVLEYDALQKYKWNTIQYSEKYSDIIFASMGHSSIGKGDYSSIITRMESEDGWPNVIRAEANSSLKLTRNSLIEALKKSEFYKKNLSSY